MANSEARLPFLKYDALPTPISIRLLQFLPPRDGRVPCDISVGNLEDNLIFQALPYTWGTPNTIWKKQVDNMTGKEKVTSNRERLSASEQDDDQASDEADAFKIFGTSDTRPYERVDKEAPKNHYIECNGCIILITKNLLQACEFFQGFALIMIICSIGWTRYVSTKTICKNGVLKLLSWVAFINPLRLLLAGLDQVRVLTSLVAH